MLRFFYIPYFAPVICLFLWTFDTALITVTLYKVLISYNIIL